MPSEPAMESEQDVYLFREGTNANVDRMFGCHLLEHGAGATFAVWAPNASAVSVIGEWNGWDPGADPLTQRRDGSGIWEGILPRVQHGNAYKYRIASRDGSRILEKADPVGFYCELPPATASRAWALDYEWQDGGWMG
jgi:1,4-alpha-glucan branching enzyme